MSHVAGLVFVVLVLAAPAYQNLGQYSDFYDGGVYLESARMVASGYAPYRAIFATQPPVWVELIRWSFAFFGQSMRSGQLLTVSSLVITAGAIGFVVLNRGAWLGTVLVCITMVHGRHGITHLLLGSVAEEVVRSAPCAVLSLTPTACGR
jgi:hypothetical protein